LDVTDKVHVILIGLGG